MIKVQAQCGLKALMRLTRFLRYRVMATFLGIAFGLVTAGVNAETLRLAASTSFLFYADPLVNDPGTGIIPSVFDGLTMVNQDGTVGPALAVSWTNTSETTWVFRLRPNVVFHDGSSFTADSVVDYLTFLTAPGAIAYPIAAEAKSISGVRKLDALSVEITTHRADGILPRKISRIPMIPLNVWSDLGRAAFSRQPVGTGPYKIEKWGRAGSSSVTMVGVETSWRAPEQIDRVEYIILPDPAARLQSLMSDAVDVAINIDPDSIPFLEDAGYTVQRQPSPINLALAFHNCGDTPSPITDRRVRLALNMAVDKKNIVDNLLSGTTEVATQGATPGVLGYNSSIEPYPYDPAAAKTLLEEAGYGDGLELVVGLFSGQFPSDSSIFLQVAQDWAAIGVHAELRPFAFTEYNRRAMAADWEGVDVISAVWSHYQYGDVSRALKRFAGDHSGPYFCAPELLDDIADSDAEMDEQARQASLEDIMARIHYLAPSLPLVRYVSLNALSPRVPEFKARTGAPQFGRMYIEPRAD